MKKKKTTMNTCDFKQCTMCTYFPDVSVNTTPYYVDEYGVKRRDMVYICKYDLHEINSRNVECPRKKND